MDFLRQKLEKIIYDFRTEVSSLRTGRATPALVEDLDIDVYGDRQPLKYVASISTPEPRQIIIQPWDKSILPAIEKAVQTSSLGLNPVADKDAIRLVLPQLTEERKRDLVKVLREKAESGRIQLRRTRDEAMKEIGTREKAKEISEDQRFREKQEVEKRVSEANRQFDEIVRRKEGEIMAG